MKFICVNEDKFDFAVLQSFVENGICSLVDITLPAQGAGIVPAATERYISRSELASMGLYTHAQRPSALARRAREYVDANYADVGCTLSAIAKSMHVSPGYLSAIFKESAGETFVSYLTALRIKRACQLLANTELMVYEVSAMVGYENHTYFSTLFKKVTGLSPKAWREKGALSEGQNIRNQNHTDNAQQNARYALRRELLPVEHSAHYHKRYRQKHI